MLMNNVSLFQRTFILISFLAVISALVLFIIHAPQISNHVGHTLTTKKGVKGFSHL